MTKTLTSAWQYDDPTITAQAQRFAAERDAKIPQEYRLPASVYPLPLNIKGIPEKSGLLSTQELKITALDATAIHQGIVSKQFTAVQVTTAFLKAAAIAQQTVNCLTDYFPQEALERAQWLDEQLEAMGKPVGPLHGVPISVKGELPISRPRTDCPDMIFVKGRGQATAFLSRAGALHYGDDAHIVASLRAAGAGS